MADTHEEDKPFLVRVGPVVVDIPRSLGFFGGLAVAVAFDLVAPELALFIAAVPFVKLLKRENATLAERAAAAVMEGAAKPVGGDADATVWPRWLEEKEEREKADQNSRSAARTVRGNGHSRAHRASGTHAGSGHSHRDTRH